MFNKGCLYTRKEDIAHISHMADSSAHFCAFPVHTLNAATWLEVIAPGNFAGSNKTWQKYEWLQRWQMTKIFLKQEKNRH